MKNWKQWRKVNLIAGSSVVVSVVLGFTLSENFFYISGLVGLMLVVVIHTFEWSSIPILVVTFLPLSARNWLNDKVFKDKVFIQYQ